MDRSHDHQSSHPQAGRVTPLLLASGNPGKLREYRALAADSAAATTNATGAIELNLLSNFASLPQFDESAPTFGENAAGKALHYSQFTEETVLADDSGLVVPALGGAPGVLSARYAGPNATDADRISKLLGELKARGGAERRARFVCVIALAERRRVLCVVSAAAEGEILEQPRGAGGFGYDPVFYFPPLQKTFAEITHEEKNLHSHRGKAFRTLQEFLVSCPAVLAPR
jgi:XTP/dITP diphosphohydrolase